MKTTHVRATTNITLAVLIFFVFFGAAAPSAQAENVCEKALAKCLMDAVVSLILSGPQTAAVFAAGCVNGYVWCLKYYVDFQR